MSLSLLEHKMESISSMKTTLGSYIFARANKVFTIFSPTPTHFDVNNEAETLKNVDLHSVAIAFPIIVLPVPGGPKRSIPFAGAHIPLNKSGQSIGKMMISLTCVFAAFRPAMSSQVTFLPSPIISFSIYSTMF